jgi:hypothetical protein
MKVKLGKYVHSKTGNPYKVIAVGKHSETLEEMVTYEAMYENPDGKVWIRPLKSFTEIVIINGKKVPRFKLIKE